MKVATLTYSANEPTRKQVVVPTFSKYAVGVKITRDGEPIDCGLGDIKINDISATSQVAGFNLFELSAGAEVIKELVVSINKEPSVNATVEQTLTGQSTMPFPLNVNLDIPLSGYVSGDIDKSWIGLPTATASDGTTTGDFWDFTEANAIYIYPRGATQPYGSVNRGQIYWLNQLSGDTIEFNENALLRYKWSFSGMGTVSVDAEFAIKSDDGLTASYPLQVMQQDMGYIEV